jgi:molybdopterin biosynthesis enzyme MoaB
VLVVSTRASAGVYADETGPVIRAWLAERGFAVGDPVVVADAVAEALAAALDGAPDLLLTTGGTGLSPTTAPPRRPPRCSTGRSPGSWRSCAAAASPRPRWPCSPAGWPGRRAHRRDEPPGSRGGVRDGLAVLDPILDHLLAQLSGRGDHR